MELLKPDVRAITSAGELVAAASNAQSANRYCDAITNYKRAAATLRSEVERMRLDASMRSDGAVLDANECRGLLDYAAGLERQCDQLEPHAAIERFRLQQQKQQDEQPKPTAVASQAATATAAAAKNVVVPPTGSYGATTMSAATPAAAPAAAQQVQTPKPPTSTPEPAKKASAPTATPGGGGGGSGKAQPGAPPTLAPLSASFKAVPAALLQRAAAGGGGGGGSGGGGGGGGNARGGGGSNWIPRASDVVYRAVEAATKLATQRHYKRAVDVLQHAYDVGMREENRPSNLAHIPPLVTQLRAKYVESKPPRPVQDNAPMADETELLARSGRTSRLLLGAWDSVEEGYVAENVFMPVLRVSGGAAAAGGASAAGSGGGGGAWEDAFVPQLTPSMRKAGARWLRLPDVVRLWVAAGGHGPLSPVPQMHLQPASDTASSPSGSASPPAGAADPLAQLDAGGNNNTPGTPPTAAASPINASEKGDPKPAVAAPPVPDSAPITADASVAAPTALISPNAPASAPTLCIFRNVVPDPHAVRQTSVSDCSLVCSLIITAAYERRFPGSRLIRSVIYPQDEVSGEPVVNPFGKYCIKMLLNGTTRCVPVDDRVPTAIDEEAATGKNVGGGTDGGRKPRLPRVLCSQSTDVAELWVPLIEKAFIKVCGGTYDFAGSSSDRDLYQLSGWLPDMVPFPLDRTVLAAEEIDSDGDENGETNMNEKQSSSGRARVSNSAERKFDSALQWSRLLRNLQRGACVATVSTPEALAPGIEEHLSLFPGHAYAVLDAKELAANLKLVKIKNPWARHTWKGLFSLEDRARATPEMLAALGYSETEAAEGIFWMSWQDCVKFFQGVHLSWNPMMLYAPISLDPTAAPNFVRPTRLTRHSTHQTLGFGFGTSPQFQIYVPPAAAAAIATGQASKRMHLVFARHVLNDLEEYGGGNDPAGERARGDRRQNKFIALHVFDTTGAPSAAAAAAAASAGSEQQPTSHGATTTHPLLAAQQFPHLWQSARLGRGRRLAGDYELPKSCCIHRGTYTNSSCFTASFDCPAGPGSGPRELTVVVARLNRGAASRNAVIAPTDPRVAPFPFSVTLYTGLPLTSGVDFLPIRRSDGSGSGLGLRWSTTSPGEWAKGRSCGGPPDGQTFAFNPQYTFHLTQPSHVRVSLNSPLDAPINVVVCRIADRPLPTGTPGGPGAVSGAGGGAPASSPPLWAWRVDRTGACDVVLRAPCSAPFSAAADSVIASHYARGGCHSQGLGRGRPQPPQQQAPRATPMSAAAVDASPPARLTLRVVGGGGAEGTSAAVTAPSICSFDFSASATSLVLRPLFCANSSATLFAPPMISAGALIVTAALARRFFATPSLSRCVFGGGDLPLAGATTTPQLWAALTGQRVDPASTNNGPATTAVPGGPSPMTLVLNTQSLTDRDVSSSLGQLELALYKCAQDAIACIETVAAGSGSGGGDTAPSLRAIALVNEEVLRVVTALDGLGADDGAGVLLSESGKKTRRCVVHSAQCVHELLDALRERIVLASKSMPLPTAASSGSGGGDNDVPQTQLRADNETRLPAGQYVVVPMVHDRGVPGPFALTLETDSDERPELVELPPEGSGSGWCALPPVLGAWGSAHQVGTSSRLPQGIATPRTNVAAWRVFASNPTIRITVPAPARGGGAPPVRVFCRIVTLPPPVDASAAAAAAGVGGGVARRGPDVQATLFRSQLHQQPQQAAGPEGLLGAPVAYSGPYSTMGVAIRTENLSAAAAAGPSAEGVQGWIHHGGFGVPLAPGSYSLVLSTYEGSCNGWRFACSIFAFGGPVTATLA